MKGGKQCLSSKALAEDFIERAGRWAIRDSQIIQIKNNTETVVIIDPNLATTFQQIKLSGKSEYRRGIPANPKKCIGKNVIFTPTNIIKNWAFTHSKFKVKAVIKGYQLITPAIKANTAPILNT